MQKFLTMIVYIDDFIDFFIWFVRLLALRPASGDSEDDCGEADGM
jgi:hypothetical protein